MIVVVVNRSAIAGTAFCGMSGIHQCSDGLKMAVASLNKQALGYKLEIYWLLLLSVDLDAFYDVSSTGRFYLSPTGSPTYSGTFPHHCHSSSPLPINYPYVSTCGIDEKLFKMARNSSSYSLKSS